MNRLNHKPSYRSLLMGMITVKTVLPMLGLAVPLAILLLQQVRTQTLAHVKERASFVEQLLSRRLEVSSARIDALARSSDLVLGANNPLIRPLAETLVDDFMKANDEVAGMALFNSQGVLILARPLERRLDLSEAVAQLPLSNTDSSRGISAIKTDENTLEFNLVFRTNLYERYTAGDIGGYLVTEVSPKILERQLNAQLDGLTRVYIRRDKTEPNQIFDESKDLVQKATVKINTNDALNLWIIEPRAKYFGALDRAVWSTIWLGVAFGLIIIILAYYFVRRMTKPFQKLNAAITDMSNNKYESLVEDYAFKEFEEVRETLLALQSANIRNLKEQREKVRLQAELDVTKELASAAATVAHDMKAPLAEIKSRLQNAQNSDVRLMKAVGVLEGIAIELLANRRMRLEQSHKQLITSDGSSGAFSSLVYPALLDIVNQRSALYTESCMLKLEIESALEFSCISLDYVEVHRIFGNLIDNGVEAGASQIRIAIARASSSELLISIKDNGHGIKSEDLANVTKLGFSKGKKSGSGLGLHVVQNLVEEAGGHLRINSKFSKGTTIYVTLPLVAKPEVVISAMDLKKKKAVVLIDDEDLYFHIWSDRLTKAGFKGVMRHERALKFDVTRVPDDEIWIVDYAFHQNEKTGLDLLRHINGGDIFLSTNHFYDEGLLRSVGEIGAKLLPKPLISSVRIELPTTNKTIILIDDNPWVAEHWQRDAEALGFTFYYYTSEDAALEHALKWERDSWVFVDVKLGKNDGLKLATSLYEQGLLHIYLTTNLAMAETLHFIKGTVDKNFPRQIFQVDSTAV